MCQRGVLHEAPAQLSAGPTPARVPARLPCDLESVGPAVQVQSGAFASKDRDAALTRMIEAAATRYSPETEQQFLQAQAAATQATAGAQGLARLSANLMRKISLSSVSSMGGFGTVRTSDNSVVCRQLHCKLLC